jgi:hypothetical protein
MRGLILLQEVRKMRRSIWLAVLFTLLCTSRAGSATDIKEFSLNQAQVSLSTPGVIQGSLGCSSTNLLARFMPPIEPVTSGTCTADCGDGSYVSCTGTSCSALDSSCPSQRGYCWSSAEGYKYCPICPYCDQFNCGCEGQACTKNSQCGTCDGNPCMCVSGHCICL